MYTKRFVKIVEGLGYEVFTYPPSKTLYGDEIMNVKEKGQEYGTCYALVFANKYGNFHLNTEDKELADIVMAYAFTSLDERAEPRKHYYQLPAMDYDGDALYLSKARSVHKKEVRMDYINHVGSNELLEFTDKEVEEFSDKYGDLFKICEKIEVSEK